MDIELSAEDLAFQSDVQNFLAANAHTPDQDYMKWRLNWFAKAREKGGWDVPKWSKEFGGPGWTPTQHYIWEKGKRKPRRVALRSMPHLVPACWLPC